MLACPACMVTHRPDFSVGNWVFQEKGAVNAGQHEGGALPGTALPARIEGMAEWKQFTCPDKI